VSNVATCALVFLGVLSGCEHRVVEFCPQDRCETASTREELIAEIEGFDDPMARYLRDEARDDGTISGDYNTLLSGIAPHVGCDASTIRSFVVLSNVGFLPKPIFTLCAEPEPASKFFVAAAGTPGHGDLEPNTLHMAAWDDDAGEYRRYSTLASEDGAGMEVNVQPEFCLGCHGGPQKLPYWQPLMNEMTKPWSQWNATPAFQSQLFDADLDTGIASGTVYGEMMADDRISSASAFEPIVRAGISRVVRHRADRLDDPADVDVALDLLRPMFCDETVNYVSEVHRSGTIRTAAVVDDAFRTLYEAMRVNGAWNWQSDSELRLELPDDEVETVVLLPVRGQSTVEAEQALVSRQVLPPLDVVRVRALDYAQPVGSEVRCEVYLRGRERILSAELPELGDDASNADLVPVLYEELMQWPLDDGLHSLVQGDGEAVLAIDRSDIAGFDAVVANPDSYLVSPLELGAALNSRVQAASRDSLLGDRDMRACWAETLFPHAPIIPGFQCSP